MTTANEQTIPIAKRLNMEPALIWEQVLTGMMQWSGFIASNIQAAEHPIFKRIRDTMKPQVTIREDGIAILPIEGVLARKPDPWEMLFFGPMEDTQAVLELVEQFSGNPDVKGVLLDIDSPGGFVTGGPEVADAVRAMQKKKPVVAWTGGLMASLAYWIGSQADTVVSSRSAIVGSIGVYATVTDYTRRLEQMGVKVELFKNKEGAFKAAGAIGTSLTDEQREHLQAGMERIFSDFRASVLRTRSQVPGDAMRGQTFSGNHAKQVQLVDAIGSREFALNLLGGMIR